MEPTAWPYYKHPQQMPSFNPYHMSYPWTTGYMPMYPYGGYYPGMGSYLQHQGDVKSHEDDSPNAKRRRLDISETSEFAQTTFKEQPIYPKSDTSTSIVPVSTLDEPVRSAESTSKSAAPLPVPVDKPNSNDLSRLSPSFNSPDQNTRHNISDNNQDENNNNSQSRLETDPDYQNQQRTVSLPESDTSNGNQFQDSLMVVLPDGSKTALMDLQLPTAPFANYKPPQQDTFVFSAPSTGKSPRSRRSTGSSAKGSGNKVCLLCNKSFPSKYKLKSHMYSHTGERPFACEVCGKGFSRGPNLKTHMRVHTGAKPFPCTRCNRGFSHPSDRVIHMVTEACLRADRILRKVSYGWECTLCDSGVMEDREHAERHARQHEAGKGLFCPVCRECFQGKKGHALVKHVRDNHPEYLAACGV